MLMMNSADFRQSRPIESGTCRLAEEITGGVYVPLETGAGFTRFPAGCCTVNQKRAIRIGVIADTHGLFDPAVRRHFKGVDHILHAGDIGDRSVIEQLEQIAPVTVVSGNVDDDEQGGFPSEAVIELAGRLIAIRHILYESGKLVKEGRAFLQEKQPDLCIFGHTHRQKVEWFGKTLLFNPGSAGPKMFSLPRGIGLLILQKEKIVPHLIRLEDKASRHHARPPAKRSKQKGHTQ